MRPSTNGISKQHPEGPLWLATTDRQPTTSQEAFTDRGARPLQPCDDMVCKTSGVCPCSCSSCTAPSTTRPLDYDTRDLPCVLPARLLTGHISISDHGLRVQRDALIINAAATVCSPRPTGDYRQAALGLVRCDGIRAPLNRPERQHPNETLLAAHSTQHTHCTAHLNSILSQGCVEARALSNDQATSYCNATPPRQHTHIRK